MYLDAAEEKMLRAIVQSAVAAAAAGHPFAGEFRHYRISATRLQVNEEGVAEVEARIVNGFGVGAQKHRESFMIVPANIAHSAIVASILTASSFSGMVPGVADCIYPCSGVGDACASGRLGNSGSSFSLLLENATLTINADRRSGSVNTTCT